VEVLATGCDVEVSDDDGVDCDTVVVIVATPVTQLVGVKGNGCCGSLVVAGSVFPSLLACCSTNSCEPTSGCHPKCG